MTINASVGAYVRAVVADCAVVVATTRFIRGENHAVYRVSYIDSSAAVRDVVVRISNSGSAADRAQAERESAVLARLEGAVSPRLLDFQSSCAFSDNAVMCLEYVAGGFEAFDAASPEQMVQLGAVVRRTHSVPVDGLAPVLNGAASLSDYVDDRLQSMLARMSLVCNPLDGSVQRQFNDVARWAVGIADQLRTADDPGPLRLLHGDVSAGNVLWTPHPVLIDWEYVRIGDPADEIGYLFGQNELRPAQREGFWRGYGDGLDPRSLARVTQRAARWEPLTLFGSALYWVDLWSRRVNADTTRSNDQSAPKAKAYYFDLATLYLNRCDHIRHRLSPP